MMLRRLSLRNYRKFRSMEVEFPSGLMGVVGRNGMGKTTVMEAVAFALYGTAASRTRAKGVRRDGCTPEEACEVELEFEIEGTPFRILRRARGAAENWQAEMYEGGRPEPIATGSSGVTDAVRQRLGMDYLTFTRSVFSKQKEVTALSDATPDQRREAIRRMVGIETITRARKMASDEMRDRKNEIEGASRAIEVLPEKRLEASSRRKEIRPARSEVLIAGKAASAAARKLNTATSRLNALEKKRTAHSRLESDISGLDSSIRAEARKLDSIEKDIAGIREKKVRLHALAPQAKAFRRAQKAKERMDRYSGKYAERVDLEREIERQKRTLAGEERRLADLDKKRMDLSDAHQGLKETKSESRKATAEVQRLQRELVLANKRQAAVSALKGRIEKAIGEIHKQGSSGKCPTCYRELGDSYDEILAHLKEERASARAACSEAEASLKEIETSVRAATKRVDLAASATRRAEEDSRRERSLKEQMDAARKQVSSLRTEVGRKEKRLTILMRVDYDPGSHAEAGREHARLTEVHEQVTALREAVAREPGLLRQCAATAREAKRLARSRAQAEKKRAAIGFEPEIYEKARKAAHGAQEEDKKAALAAQKARDNLARIKGLLKVIDDDIKRLEMLRKQIASDEEEVRYLGRIVSLLDDFRNDLIGRVRPLIEERASFLLDQVTAGRYPRVVLNEDYDISLNDGAGEYPLYRFSGGEEDLANLCLRIAISQVVAERAGSHAPSFVVLDEVFAAQDVERREKLLQALARLQEVFQQIILITHMEDLHDRVPNLLRITENAAQEADASWA